MRCCPERWDQYVSFFPETWLSVPAEFLEKFPRSFPFWRKEERTTTNSLPLFLSDKDLGVDEWARIAMTTVLDIQYLSFNFRAFAILGEAAISSSSEPVKYLGWPDLRTFRVPDPSYQAHFRRWDSTSKLYTVHPRKHIYGFQQAPQKYRSLLASSKSKAMLILKFRLKAPLVCWGPVVIEWGGTDRLCSSIKDQTQPPKCLTNQTQTLNALANLWRKMKTRGSRPLARRSMFRT